MDHPSAPRLDPGAGLEFRRARFEDVPDLLRLIERAVERGCRYHYRPLQRRAVVVTYARTFFLEVMGRFDTVVAWLDGARVAVAQLDPGADRLRALFVDATAQRRGVGSALLSRVTALAEASGCLRLQGAMALNAVPFYSRAGFRPSAAAGGSSERLSVDGIPVPVLPMEKRLAPSAFR